MEKNQLDKYTIDYVEIYTPMAKALAYWHTQALGFSVTASCDIDTGKPGILSYVLTSGRIRLVLTSAYPMCNAGTNNEITSFITQNYCGIKRFALQVESVRDAFDNSIRGGAFPLKFPHSLEDEDGTIEEASIKLYDHSEIVFINRASYGGVFKPGYRRLDKDTSQKKPLLSYIDHIAGEVRINETSFWTNYLAATIGTSLVQSILPGEANKTGMILRINQSHDNNLTLVIAEPETYLSKSKVQRNIDTFGPGIHHIAFATDDLVATIRRFNEKNVEFVKFPDSYYEILRGNTEFEGIDIDSLQEGGILIDKEEDAYLLQKFIKPISDRPFFLYEIVQRVNGYSGFALKNINVLKKAEEMEIQKI